MKKKFMFCRHIWINHQILSILSIHVEDKNDNTPDCMLKKVSGALGAKLGPEVIRTSSTFWTSSGGVGGGVGAGVGVRSEPECPP